MSRTMVVKYKYGYKTITQMTKYYMQQVSLSTPFVDSTSFVFSFCKFLFVVVVVDPLFSWFFMVIHGRWCWVLGEVRGYVFFVRFFPSFDSTRAIGIFFFNTMWDGGNICKKDVFLSFTLQRESQLEH